MKLPAITATTHQQAQISVLRWDQNHPLISGNKAEKLLWHRALIRASNIQQVCSMGGPWSNALHALGASLCPSTPSSPTQKAIAIIRGERPQTPSPTLRDLTQWGIAQHFVSRQSYRELRNSSQGFFNTQPPIDRALTHKHFRESHKECSLVDHSCPIHVDKIHQLPGIQFLLQSLKEEKAQQLINQILMDSNLSQIFLHTKHNPIDLPYKMQRTWWIPEGGAGTIGVWSVAAWALKLARHLEKLGMSKKAWIVPIGSGATFQGILAGASLAGSSTPKKIVGVPVYKGGNGLRTQLQKFIQHWALPLVEARHDQNTQKACLQWELWENFHWGGFAKYPQFLADEHPALEHRYKTPLDRVYTLKVAAALEHWLKNQKDTAQSKVINSWLFFHTGGLQGNREMPL